MIFYSFGEGAEGGEFYDSLSLKDALASADSAGVRNELQAARVALHGAPLRLRVESQLGFKMVKWIQSDRVRWTTCRQIYKGEGGYNEDNEYFGELPTSDGCARRHRVRATSRGPKAAANCASRAVQL